MFLVITFTLVGLVLGAMALGYDGWLIGTVLGFLAGQVLNLSNKLAEQSRHVAQLLAWQKKLQEPELKSPPPVSTPVVNAQTAGSPVSEHTHAAVKAPEIQKTEAVADMKLDLDLPDMASPPHKPKPAQPDPLTKLTTWVQRFFTEGNPIVRIGMVVMFFGLSFLVKYTANQGLLPLELRMAMVAAVSVVLIVLGWKTRHKAGGYGLVLQGGGVAALYLTLFAAAKLYEVMPVTVALAFMLLTVAVGVLLALLQNAQVLSLMATAGGFLAPILTSDGSGNHVALFSFYLLLNLGILAIAWFKTWRLLNWIGFVFTFVISTAWGVLDYQPHLYASTQPFLLAFFALYLLVSVLFSLKQPPNLKGLVDASLVFGLPIVGFALQTALLKHTEYGLAISALVLAAVYIGLARFLWFKYQQTHRVLIESFIALGVGFATLAIPLALSAQWTSASWALEAIGLIWVGLRQQRLLPRFAGYCLHLAAAVALIIQGIATGPVAIISGDFIGLLILSLTALCAAYLLHRYAQQALSPALAMARVALAIGWLWWLFAGVTELQAHVPGEYLIVLVNGFFVASTLVILLISRNTAWPGAASLGFWLLPLVALWSLRHYGESLFIGYSVYPSQGWGLLGLLAFFAVQYRILWLQQAIRPAALLSAYHVLTAWFLWLLVYWEASYWQSYFNWQGTTKLMLWFACVVIPLSALLYLAPKACWPFTAWQRDYRRWIPAPLVILLGYWFIHASHYTGITDYFYLPIINPLDVAQAAVLIVLVYIYRRDLLAAQQWPTPLRWGLLGGLGFVWLNLVVLRALHHYTGVAYHPEALWHSGLVQMALSILWSLCALVVMNISRRIQWRELWLIGAGLLAIVLIKLFTKDLGDSGTLARIISFMVVGGLMLLIGYLSPIPGRPVVSDPEKGQEEKS